MFKGKIFSCFAFAIKTAQAVVVPDRFASTSMNPTIELLLLKVLMPRWVNIAPKKIENVLDHNDVARKIFMLIFSARTSMFCYAIFF